MILQYERRLLLVSVLGLFWLQLAFAVIIPSGGGGSGGDGPQTVVGNAVLRLLIQINRFSNYLPTGYTVDRFFTNLGNVATNVQMFATPIFGDVIDVGRELGTSISTGGNRLYNNCPNRAALRQPITACYDVMTDLRTIATDGANSVMTLGNHGLNNLRSEASQIRAEAISLSEDISKHLPTTEDITSTIRKRLVLIITGTLLAVATAYILFTNTPSTAILNPLLAGSLADVVTTRASLPSIKKLAFKYGPSLITVGITGASSYYIFSKYCTAPIVQMVSNIFTDPALLRPFTFQKYLQRLRFWKNK